MARGTYRSFQAFKAILLPLILGCLAVSNFGQTSPSKIPPTSEVKLIVTDPVGAVIRHAEVVFKGQDTLTTQQTSQDGSIHVTLPDGRYVVTITSPGFKTTKIVDYVVDASRRAVSDVTLQIESYDKGPLGVDLGSVLVSSKLPNVIEPDVTGSLWSWFGNCRDKRYVGLEVDQSRRVVYRSFFPICPVADRGKAAEGQKKIVAFSIKGGHAFQGEHHTTPTEMIEGNIWQAGTDAGAILLGLSFSTKKQILLNTIHVARVDCESTSEIDRDLIVRTFPTSKPK